VRAGGSVWRLRPRRTPPRDHAPDARSPDCGESGTRPGEPMCRTVRVDPQLRAITNPSRNRDGSRQPDEPPDAEQGRPGEHLDSGRMRSARDVRDPRDPLQGCGPWLPSCMPCPVPLRRSRGASTVVAAFERMPAQGPLSIRQRRAAPSRRRLVHPPRPLDDRESLKPTVAGTPGSTFASRRTPIVIKEAHHAGQSDHEHRR
jgi:hypothetical protein